MNHTRRNNAKTVNETSKNRCGKEWIGPIKHASPVDTDWTRRSEVEQPNHALCNALQLNALEPAKAMVDKTIT